MISIIFNISNLAMGSFAVFVLGNDIGHCYIACSIPGSAICMKIDDN